MRNGLRGLGLMCLGGLACSGSSGPAGPAGPAGAPGAAGPPGGAATPTAGLVTPGVGLLGRTVQVTIAGENLGFAAATAPTFDFGANVTVSNVQVIDPDSAIATVQVATAAAIGPRNVSFMAGTTMLTATNAFDIEPPLEVSLATLMGKPLGQAQQGNLAALAIHNVDTANALDANVLYENTGSSLLSALDQTSTDLSAAVLFDPLSPPGPLQIQLANPALDGSAGLTYVSAPSALTVTARAPTAIAGGKAKSDALANPFDANTYKLSTTGAALVALSVTSDDTDPIVPRMRVYGTDGLSDQLLDDVGGPGLLGNTPAADLFPVAADATTYLTVLDGSFGGGPGYSYALTPTVTAVANVITAPTTAHGTPATSPDETTPCVPGPCIIKGSLTGAGQTDGYAITLSATATVTVSLSRAQKTGVVVIIAPATSDGSAFDYTADEASSSQAVPFQPANVANSVSTPGSAGKWYVTVFDAGSQVGGTVSTGDYLLSIQTM